MKRKVIISIAVIIAVLFGGAIIWVSNYYKPENQAVEALAISSNVEVTKSEYIVFTPKDKQVNTGFIFYPGGKVAPEAYSPLCRKIAEKGYKVVIVPMPLNLAVLSPGKAKAVQEKFPEIKNWAIGGHSLGGVMAADYAHSNSRDIKALIMYASYPQDKDDISSTNIKVLSLWGSEDGLVDKTKIENSKRLVPQDAVFMPIKGGNHCQFGSYGFQKGDNKSEISSLDQQSTAAEYTVKVLETIK